MVSGYQAKKVEASFTRNRELNFRTFESNGPLGQRLRIKKPIDFFFKQQNVLGTMRDILYLLHLGIGNELL